MKGNQGVYVWQILFLIAWQRRGDAGKRSEGGCSSSSTCVPKSDPFFCTSGEYEHTQGCKWGSRASAQCLSWELVAVGASIAHKWSLTAVSSPSHLPNEAVEILVPQPKPTPLQKCFSGGWLSAQCAWPPCFSLFLNPPNVILAVPITLYQSPVLPWILLSTWPQQYLWRGPFTSSRAVYSYFIFVCF